MADLRALNRRERRILNTLVGLEVFVKNYVPAKDECQVSVRLETLASIKEEFYDVREQIEEVMDEADDKDVDKEAQNTKNLLALSSFEERYYSVKASLLSPQTPTSSTSTSVGRSEASFSKVKLPEIHLPSFNGKIKEWITFRDGFRSLIHENSQLSDMDRFSYLKSALSGEALQEVESVELSAANYSVAWNALVARYENKKLIVKAHLDSMFATEALKRESYDGLSNLISVFEKNVQMLRKIGEEPHAWSTILAYMVYTRLDPATLRQWETHHNSKDVPTYRRAGLL